MQDAYATKELAKIIGISERAILEKARRENWQERIRASVGRGRPTKEYLTASLPDDVRSSITLAEAKSSPTPQALPGLEVVIPDKAHRTGLDRYRIVHDCRAHVEKSKTGKVEAVRAWVQAYNSGVILPQIRERIGEVSDKSLYRWDKTLRDNEDDYRCLCDRRGGWVKGGAKGLGQLGDEAERIFLKCYLQPNRPSVLLAARATNAALEKQGRPTPSDASYYRFLERFDAANHDVVVLMREGEKALKDKVGPFITRDDKILSVGDIIFSDGHTLNFESINPFTGRPCRLTLIMWFDWRSRMPVGWEVMPSENTLAISSALRMAIMNLGKYPRVAYMDNGKAFRAKYFTQESDLDDLKGLYARLGIAVQYSKPYEARTKIVERFWRTLGDQCERILPSYCGASIDDKPAWRNRNEGFLKSRHSDYVPTLQETANIIQVFVQWYAHQPHEGLGGQRPIDLFEAGRGQGVQVEDLNRHFLWTKKCAPKRCRITIAGVAFESECLYGLNQQILVRYSCADLSEVYLYALDGTPIGAARPVEALSPLAKHFGDQLDMLKVKEANKRQRQLRSTTLKLVRELEGSAAEAAGLEQLPWMQREKAPIQPVKPKEIPAEPELDRAEVERLEAKRRAIAAQDQEKPTYTTPGFFADQLERYSCLFDLSVKQHITLTAADAAFMSAYESSDEYLNYTGRRFEQLRNVYSKSVANS